MSTPAVYTFKCSSPKKKPDVHLVYRGSGNPSDAVDVIADLVKVVTRIWRGESVDLKALNLPLVDRVSRRKSLVQSKPSTPFRYEVEMVDGRPVVVRALRHEPAVSEKLKQRLKSARAALEAVEREMEAARDVPTYVPIGKGNLDQIKRLGTGYQSKGL